MSISPLASSDPQTTTPTTSDEPQVDDSLSSSRGSCFFFPTDDDSDDDSCALERASDGSSSSLTNACQSLKAELKLDLNAFNNLEREMALEMLKEKLELRRGLRGLAPLSPRGVVVVKNTNKKQQHTLTNDERWTALEYVKGRVRDLRKDGWLASSSAYNNNNNNKKKTATNTRQTVKGVSKLQRPAKHRLTKMAERKEVRPPLRPTTNNNNHHRPAVANQKHHN